MAYPRWKEACLMFLLQLMRAIAGPALQSFDLNLDTGELAVTFDKAVSNETGHLDWTGISMRTHVNELEGSGVTLWNTQGTYGWGQAISLDDGLTLSVQLHPKDLDNLKGSCVGHNTSFTWITLRSGTFQALHGGQYNEPVYGTQVVGREGLSVQELVQDLTSPTLDRFTLGSTTHQVLLYFSEGVALSALDVSALALSRSGQGFGNVSLNCSSAQRGEGDTWRQIVFDLDEPCPLSATSSAVLGGIASLNLSHSASSEAFSSDWDMLRTEGIVMSGEGDDATGSVLLSASANLVTDLSAAANPLVPVRKLDQVSPDCQPCGNGTYRSEPCTELYDAVCTRCTQACPPADHFVLGHCTAETDLDCHRCTPCPLGTRGTGGCEGTLDRTCETCTPCGEGEYESRPCNTGGDDRICESCLRCSMSPAVLEACRKSPLLLPWQRENCCETAEGEEVACKDVVLENLRISARESRRHWVFEPSIPPVAGYTQSYWGQGREARDAVVAQDELIKVEFRPGARSVFDDPRYVGQEGPTGGGAEAA